MKLLNKGDKVGIIACSNGVDKSMELKMNELKRTLNFIGLNVIFSNTIYKKYSVFNGSGKERANELMKLFEDRSIKAIFDISGGDLANGILEYLDFYIIRKNSKLFFGYSDLSVVINALYAKNNIQMYLYQIRNLIGDNSEIQIKNFIETFMEDKKSLFDFKYEWIQGKSIEGIVVGGNIRCFLKLAGTEYIPKFKDKILLLESLSGDVAKMATYLTHYKQLGVFKEIKGIILGNFTEMENNQYSPSIIELVKDIVSDENMPIVKTSEIGHGPDSKCIIIGENIELK
ncbi:LD-carboxypeptidase [Clostridium botulinum]|uniref:S66 family peptidase n=1 Tax=unclassified Clostridium TaxID=2614128 RepID=UPI0013C85C54|nr:MULTISPECIES: S66 peptidase family protein [unclassified Clostridium]MBY7008045.1 LD-carboxypeptidase [Clostridium botulinum]NFH72829.1 LD-carboxypeptidase [Clostridium botulinum]NFI01024.1 LD-carboxypeptidase [Clostridium botulinum]NFI63100.1 LD-carboxypeptidase [Clostridium botulinum]NFI81222.1 LD-carboxypeptidase [Clostridium botulinum]